MSVEEQLQAWPPEGSKEQKFGFDRSGPPEPFVFMLKVPPPFVRLNVYWPKLQCPTGVSGSL